MIRKRVEISPAKTVALIALFLMAIAVWLATPAAAIPSPELVIGSVSSLSQLFAVAAATVTGAGTLFAKRLGFSARPNASGWITQLALGLYCGCLLLISLNIYQVQQARAAELERLQATLLRPAQFDGTAIKDENLVETGYVAQSASALAITTSEAELLLAEPNSAQFVDVRERGEHQMGTLNGAVHVRYPDFPNSEYATGGMPLVLFCHNGNRSGETCEKLAAKGIDCRFIAGGIEKWLVEGRSLSDRSIETLSDLRSLPDYTNKDTLLSTEDFTNALARTYLQIVDTRYPADFAAGHLPGAVNIPIRALPSGELADRIAKLSSAPTVAACYDRRSCFMSQVLGLELVNAGIPFLGRYTTPWDYFVPPPPKPHVSAWLVEQERSNWQRAIDSVAYVLIIGANQSHLIAALLSLAILSRLLVLPITLKSERDQIVAKANRWRLDELKSRLAHDPTRKARAIKQFYAELGLTPMRNLIGLLFLPLMMLGLSAAEQAARAIDQGLFGLSLGLADPTWIAPAAFSILASCYLQWVAAKSTKQAVFWWVVGFPLIFVLVVRLTLAGNVYLCFSLSLLLLQRAFVTGSISHLKRKVVASIVGFNKRLPVDGVFRLDQQEALINAGNKSLRLSALKRAGFNVPDGVVITQTAIAKFQAMTVAQQESFAELIWHSIGERPCAVRSSTSAEDGADESYAGVFDSALDVERGDMKAALTAVIQSFSAHRVGHYQQSGTTGDANILVQQMVDAEFAGVVFTQDPSACGMAMVELVQGTGDDLVSGRVTPETFRFGRYSKSNLGQSSPPIDLIPLVQLCSEIEQCFDAPQDIEWAYAHGEFFILQSRDITAFANSEAASSEIASHLTPLLDRFSHQRADEIILELDEMSEVLPQPTPSSFSLMARLWGAGGSLDLACRRLGLSYRLPEGLPGHLVLLFGKTFVDRQLKQKTALRMSKAKSKQLLRSAPEFLKDYRTKTLPRLQAKARRWSAVDFSKLPSVQIVECISELEADFVVDAYVEAEVVNIYADFLTSKAHHETENDPDGQRRLASPVLPHAPTQLIATCADLRGADRRHALLDSMGHRSSYDYELSKKRYDEDFASLKVLADAMPPYQANVDAINTDDIASLAIAFQDLKEQAKHEALRFVANIRRALLALGKAEGLDELIFHARLEELAQVLGNEKPTFRLALETRRDDRARLSEMAPKLSTLTLSDLEILSSGNQNLSRDNASLGGTCVSGQSQTKGAVFRADNVTDPTGAFADFKDGDIIVCQMLNPDWLPYVQRSGGILTEVGGWLSHMAIVAREKGIMMLVNCSGLDSLENGQLITVDTSGAIEKMNPKMGAN